MDFSLSDEQQLLRDSARKFLQERCHSAVLRELESSDTGFSAELWREMVAQGWTGIVVAEAHGGSGLGFLELGVLLEEIGRAAFDSPFFANLMATLAIQRGGGDAQKQRLLPDVVSGDTIISPAIEELGVSYEPRFITTRAVRTADGFILSGGKMFVPYANIVDRLLVLARTAGEVGDEDGCSLLLVERTAPGVEMTRLETIAPDRQFQVDFDEVLVPADALLGEPGDALRTVRDVHRQGAALICAEMVGGAERQLAATAEYVKQRVQFDRPLGSFQAVQHHLADMYTLVQGSRWTTYQAIDKLDRDGAADREIAIAKAFSSEACQRVAALAQQLHGGVGVDMANDLQFYFRRAKAMELKFGPTPVHLRRLGEQL
ncbi:MAG: acyl-CoA dehydrogenase family protein [Steroidobacteraceae bacterium]|jgi:alkylation response protein AidB-like acyl-CoA dehydrogenase|nr:acyl-CoA dehydrogenase family protein [Steroidobacteraceae bacterium]